MLKLTAKLKNSGTLYCFGLSETNLNRLEFNNEPIFFDFDYAGHSDLFGLILYFDEFKEPTEIAANPHAVERRCIPFLNEKHNVTEKTLRVFPIAQNIMKTLRSKPLWSFQSKTQIANPDDIQLFLSARTEQELEQYFRREGFISPQTKEYKGFRKR
ncbi:hypothetical protein [Nostoc sp.]|uniref:hypothetical protein n=1 Tax=Nostoc sp. TaxID=1180 RepID=UPI002FFBE1F3